MKRKKSYAVITGASSGIGREFAMRMAAEGYNLVLVARRVNILNELKDELEKIGINVRIVKADLSDIEGCNKLLQSINKLPVHVFINNAGFGDCGYFMEQNVDKEMSMIDVNIKAMHYLTKHILKYMDKYNTGYILNVASSAGLFPAGPYMSTYYATKAYVTSFTRGIALELKDKGSKIYVGCLCPGPVDTEFNDVANVEFALKGISTSYCVDYAVRKMKKRQVVIIPTLKMKMAICLGRFIPQDICIKFTAHQQKKKISI